MVPPFRRSSERHVLQYRSDRGLRVYAEGVDDRPVPSVGALDRVHRSEEHTSELQSRLHLVCRLLLEKKKKSKHLALRDDETSPLDSDLYPIVLSAFGD